MAHQVVTGIVTRYVNYRDNDRILSIFTREQGRVDAKARGCRRPKSPLLACSQPFVFGEFQLFQMKDRYVVDQCDVRETFYPLREDIQKLTAAMAMLDMAQQVVQEGEANEELFSLLYHTLSFLCYGDCHPADLTICFMIRLLNAIGYRPSLISCASCGKDLRAMRRLYFSTALGGALCPDCAAGRGERQVSSLALEALLRMLRLTDEGIERVRLPAHVQKELLGVLDAYAGYLLEKENKPLSQLRDFYGAG